MEIIDQIRQVANIVEIASLYTTLRKRGKKHVGLCPFHSEKDPSFTVDSDKQLFHCFGCGVGGDVFTLVMEKENLSFPEAVRYFAEKYHIPLPRQTKLSPELAKLEDKVFKINEMALAFFRRNLFQTQEGEAAQAYLRKRNLSGETLEALKIGYAPNSWNALLNYFQGKGVELPLLEKAGLILPGQKKPDFYDRFRGRVIFPIFSLTGKVLAFGGRTVVDADPKYLNSPDTPVYSKGKVLYGLNWTKETVREAEELILVEGYTDFASLFQAGIKNIAASLGTSLTTDQAELARRFATNIIINYDGDSAGKMAASRGISIFIEQGQSPNVVILPENLDPDSYLQKYGKERYLMQLRKGTVPLIKFLADQFSSKDKINSFYEKIQIAEKIINLVEINPARLEGMQHLKQLSEYLNLEEKLLRDRIKAKLVKKNEEEGDFLLPAEKRLLQILLDNHTVAFQVLTKAKEEDFKGLRSEPAFKFLVENQKKGKKATFPELFRCVEPDLSRCLSQIMLEQAERGTEQEALDCLVSLRKTALETQLRILQKEIIRCERNGEKDKLSRLLSQKQNLTRQIVAM